MFRSNVAVMALIGLMGSTLGSGTGLSLPKHRKDDDEPTEADLKAIADAKHKRARKAAERLNKSK